MIRQPRSPLSFATMLTVALLVAALGGCATPASAGTAVAPPGLPRAATPSAAHAPSPAAAASRRPTKLLVVVLENHDAASAIAGMPFLAAQAAHYGRATSYFALTHPSLPNYLAMVGGTTFGVRDDRNPSGHRIRGSSVFGQVARRGRTATTYAEGMQGGCQLTNRRRYAVRHNPWTYFVSEQAACRRHDVPAGTPRRGSLHDDVVAGRLPTFGLVVPDRCNDAHDCTLRTADRWLRSWLGVVQSGPDWRAGRLAVFVTFDEAFTSGANHVAAVMLHPSLHGRRVTGRLDHLDLSASVSRLVGSSPLRQAAHRRGVLAAFGLA